MTAKRIALTLVVLAVLAIVAAKASTRGTASTAATMPAALVSRPAVVLVANAREADSECGCGQIIRRVRAAKAHGITVEEVAPGDLDVARRYGVTVVPTVVFLDAAGQVIARREGESPDILAAVSTDLSGLEGARR